MRTTGRSIPASAAYSSAANLWHHSGCQAIHHGIFLQVWQLRNLRCTRTYYCGVWFLQATSWGPGVSELVKAQGHIVARLCFEDKRVVLSYKYTLHVLRTRNVWPFMPNVSALELLARCHSAPCRSSDGGCSRDTCLNEMADSFSCLLSLLSLSLSLPSLSHQHVCAPPLLKGGAALSACVFLSLCCAARVCSEEPNRPSGPH